MNNINIYGVSLLTLVIYGQLVIKSSWAKPSLTSKGHLGNLNTDLSINGVYAWNSDIVWLASQVFSPSNIELNTTRSEYVHSSKTIEYATHLSCLSLHKWTLVCNWTLTYLVLIYSNVLWLTKQNYCLCSTLCKFALTRSHCLCSSLVAATRLTLAPSSLPNHSGTSQHTTRSGISI